MVRNERFWGCTTFEAATMKASRNMTYVTIKVRIFTDILPPIGILPEPPGHRDAGKGQRR